MLPSLTDHDTAWAFKVEDPADESDDSYSLLEEDETSGSGPDKTPPVAPPEKPQPLPAPARERKPSLPLPLILANNLNTGPAEPDASEKQQIKDLVKLAHEVLAVDPDEIAQEITRVEVKLFLDIKVYLFIRILVALNTSSPTAETLVTLHLCLRQKGYYRSHNSLQCRFESPCRLVSINSEVPCICSHVVM